MTYARMITELTGRSDPKEVAAIESLMRDQFSTLDHLDRATFRKEAKLAGQCVDEIKIDFLKRGARSEYIDLARSYGFVG